VNTAVISGPNHPPISPKAVFEANVNGSYAEQAGLFHFGWVEAVEG
jgi:hypothetical protein